MEDSNSSMCARSYRHIATLEIAILLYLEFYFAVLVSKERPCSNVEVGA